MGRVDFTRGLLSMTGRTSVVHEIPLTNR
jgi:hypothetical protein